MPFGKHPPRSSTSMNPHILRRLQHTVLMDLRGAAVAMSGTPSAVRGGMLIHTSQLLPIRQMGICGVGGYGRNRVYSEGGSPQCEQRRDNDAAIN